MAKYHNTSAFSRTPPPSEDDSHSFGNTINGLILLGISALLFAASILSSECMQIGWAFFTVALIVFTIDAHGVLWGFYHLKSLPLDHDYAPFYNKTKNPEKVEGMPITDGASWYTSRDYCVELTNSPNLKTCIGKSSEYVRAMPWYLKIRSSVFYFGLLICLVLGILPIPSSVFEGIVGNSTLAFYFRYIILAIIDFFLMISLNVINTSRHERLRLLAKMLVEYNKDYALATPVVESIQRIESFNKYYNICPSCGAEASNEDATCSACGISLLISVKEQVDDDGFHYVQTQQSVSKVMNSLEKDKVFKRTNIEKWYHDVCPKCKKLASENDSVCQACGSLLVISNINEVSEFNRHKLTTSASGKILTNSSDSPTDMKSHWYYNTCQRCQTEAGENDKICSECGKPLIIENMSFIPLDERHQVKS